jgi:hypothetical protein
MAESSRFMSIATASLLFAAKRYDRRALIAAA